MTATYELTDTFSGEANYSWVKEGKVSAKTSKGIVRLIKKELGLTNVRCRKEDYGDNISLYPQGICQVLFITFVD